MDMMDSMQSVVFPDESDSDGPGDSFTEYSDNEKNSLVVDFSENSSTMGEDNPLLRKKDSFPDTPTKNDFLIRLGGHRSKDSMSEPMNMTPESRLQRKNENGGVDLLHLDAPVSFLLQRCIPSNLGCSTYF